jgi:hypothetical protein
VGAGLQGPGVSSRRYLILIAAGALAFGVSILLGTVTVGALIFAAALMMLLGYYPRLALTLWVLVICFVPFWLGVTIGSGPYISPGSAVALVSAFAIVLHNRFALTKTDWWCAAIVIACLIPGLFGLSRVGDVSTIAAQWVLGYLMGRLLVRRTGIEFAIRLVTILLSVAGALAVIEFLSGTNPFVLLVADNSYFAMFGRIQERGGILRAEGAFGHSIALGHSLVLAIPLIFAGRWTNLWKTVMLTAVVAGAVCSFSRSAMFSAVLAVVLSVLFVRGSVTRAQRALTVLGGAIALLVAIPFVSNVLGGAGAEASSSTDYRTQLFSLVASMKPFGLASNYVETSDNRVSFGDFESIDSTFIFVGVRFGLVPLLVLVLAAIALMVAVVQRKAATPLVAVAGILPGIATAALLSQYGMLVWFFLGMAALASEREHQSDPTHTSVGATNRLEAGQISAESRHHA